MINTPTPESSSVSTKQQSSSSTVAASAPLKPNEILPSVDTQSNPSPPAAAKPPARTPNPQTSQTEQSQEQSLTTSQKSEEREREEGGGFLGGLGKAAKKIDPMFLLLGMGAASMLGAPPWMIMAGGVVGLLLVTAGRNDSDDPSPPPASDISLGTAREPERGRGLELSKDSGDISLGAASPNSNSRTTSQNNDITLGKASPTTVNNTGLPKLSGVEVSNADSILPPASSPANEQMVRSSSAAHSIT